MRRMAEEAVSHLSRIAAGITSAGAANLSHGSEPTVALLVTARSFRQSAHEEWALEGACVARRVRGANGALQLRTLVGRRLLSFGPHNRRSGGSVCRVSKPGSATPVAGCLRIPAPA